MDLNVLARGKTGRSQFVSLLLLLIALELRNRQQQSLRTGQPNYSLGNLQ